MSSATTPSDPLTAQPDRVDAQDHARLPFVVLIRWPDEATTVDELRAAGTPRLLVVAADAEAPLGTACEEDWIRIPATDEDLRVRMQTVAKRSLRHSAAPEVKGDGRISFRGRWAALGGTEEVVARTLCERFGEVVNANSLARSVEPQLSSNAVRIHIMRLRTRLKPLGLELRTVRSHGYVLEAGVSA